MLSISQLLFISLVGILWVTYDAVRKVLVNRIKLLPLLIFLELGQGSIYFIYSYLSGNLLFNTGYLLPGIVTAIFAASGTFLLTYSISISPLSSVIPFLSFLPFFTVIFGALILGEKMTILQFIGLILLVLASFIINFKGKRVNSFTGLFKQLYKDLLSEKGCLFMILTSLLWAFAIPFDKISMGFVGPYSHALYHSISSATIFSIARIFSKKAAWGTDKYIQGHDFNSSKGFIILGVINASIALLIQFIAYQNFDVGFVESYKRAVSLIANLFLGFLLFKEPINKFKVIGTILVLFATLLILNI